MKEGEEHGGAHADGDRRVRAALVVADRDAAGSGQRGDPHEGDEVGLRRQVTVEREGDRDTQKHGDTSQGFARDGGAAPPRGEK